MSWIPEALLGLHNYRNGVSSKKAALQKSASPLRIGVLSAATINYAAIIDPVATHPDCVLAGIAARDIKRAEAQIQKNSLQTLSPPCKAYGSYDSIIDDPDIDAVYIPLPNGLHAEWATKALRKGKHVLLEKPFANNAAEVREVNAEAEKAGKVLMEAFHWRFHPAAHWIRQRIDEGQWGDVTGVEAKLKIFGGAMDKGDIRFSYPLGGGACMDLAYVFSSCSYFGGSPAMASSSVTVDSATPRIHSPDKRIDEAMDSTFTISTPGKPPVKCHVQADMAQPRLMGLIPKLWDGTPTIDIELTKARVEFSNFVVPTFMHSITIREKDGQGKFTGKKTVERAFTGGSQWQRIGVTGESWWTTYRFQLEAFVRAVKAKEAGEKYDGPTVTLEESENVMKVIDAVYEKAGLPKRGV